MIAFDTVLSIFFLYCHFYLVAAYDALQTEQTTNQYPASPKTTGGEQTTIIWKIYAECTVERFLWNVAEILIDWEFIREIIVLTGFIACSGLQFIC